MPPGPVDDGPRGIAVILPAEVKRLLAFGGIAASPAVAGSTQSAPRPLALLTYAVASPSAPGLCLARSDGNADGSGRPMLINSATDPAWSPDGSRIAYVSYLSRFSETGNIAVAKADGTGARRLTKSTEPETSPAWSPAGTRIAFVRGGSVVVANTGGGGERVAVGGALDPAWRPQVVLAQARRAAC